MSENQKRILEMLAEKKISVDEAERLLSLVNSEPDTEIKMPGDTPEKKRNPKYLRVLVQPGTENGGGGERVNVRVPIALIRAGIKLTSLIPAHASDHVNEALREKGINFDISKLKAEDFEELVDALSDLEVDVEGGKEKVRVYVE